jgi:endo-1,4-beta-mannosidase
LGEFVKNIRGNFVLEGKTFRFIGANMYEIADVEPQVTKAAIRDADSQGFRVLRFWLFENRQVKEQLSRLNIICDEAGRYGIKLIISLADKWGYLQNYRTDEKWYESGYKGGYLDYVKRIVSGAKHRREIMIWELINEPMTGSFETFYDFAKHVSEEIKTVNENHLVSIGTVGGIGDKFGGYFSIFKRSNFEKIYNLPSLDAVSLHDYSYDSGIFERFDVLNRLNGNYRTAAIFEKINELLCKFFNKIDESYLKRGILIYPPLMLRQIWNSFNKKNIEFAKNINKPVYIGEAGFKRNSRRNRLKILDIDIGNKFAIGVSGYVLWSFESQGCSNDGHGYGFGLEDGFGEVVKKWNDYLNQSLPEKPGSQTDGEEEKF